MNVHGEANDRRVAEYREVLAKYGIEDPRTQAYLIDGDHRINPAEHARRRLDRETRIAGGERVQYYPWQHITEWHYQTVAEREADWQARQSRKPNEAVSAAFDRAAELPEGEFLELIKASFKDEGTELRERITALAQGFWRGKRGLPFGEKKP